MVRLGFVVAALLPFAAITTAVAQAQEPRGMTWGSYENAATGDGVVFVGCHGKPRTAQGSCDAYVGDTACTTRLPLLCLRVDGRPRPPGLITGKGHAMAPDFYAGWAQGEVKAGKPVAGMELRSQADANALCAAQFGPGWRLAEFHDAVREGSGENGEPASHGGWNFYAAGALDAETRYWVAINDTEANCWSKKPAPTPPPQQIAR